MLHSRWRRATMAAVASLCASAAIVPATPSLHRGISPIWCREFRRRPPITPDVDTGQVNWGGLFDDHSIGGDDHMGWSHSGSIPRR